MCIWKTKRKFTYIVEVNLLSFIEMQSDTVNIEIILGGQRKEP